MIFNWVMRNKVGEYLNVSLIIKMKSELKSFNEKRYEHLMWALDLTKSSFNLHPWSRKDSHLEQKQEKRRELDLRRRGFF